MADSYGLFPGCSFMIRWKKTLFPLLRQDAFVEFYCCIAKMLLMLWRLKKWYSYVEEKQDNVRDVRFERQVKQNRSLRKKRGSSANGYV
jgi:hypothetical protein